MFEEIVGGSIFLPEKECLLCTPPVSFHLLLRIDPSSDPAKYLDLV
jgi:hypothetical protein